MTKHPDLFAALASPFDPSEVKERRAGNRQVPYVTARTVMNRLDNVLGPENWWDEFIPGENSVLCRLTIRMPDGQLLTKADAGGYAGMDDSGDDDKSGYSDAFKRAAVKFGAARYLYRDGVPQYLGDAAEAPSGKLVGDATEMEVTPPPAAPARNGTHRKERHEWNGASAPTIAGPVRTEAPTAKPKADPKAPRTGKALFAWLKEHERNHGEGAIKYLIGWGKLQDFPGHMINWSAEQVGLAYAEVCRKLASLNGAVA